MMAIDLSQYDEDTRMAAAALLEMKRREQSLKRISGLWEPQSEAQRMALASPAQELFFGGAAGGGKSDLLLGAALTRHWKSIILRREFPQMRAIVERSRDLLASTDASYNEQQHFWKKIPAPRIRRRDGSVFHQYRTLEFGNCKHEDDKGKYQGRDHGLKGFDELPQFTRSQYTFIIGWTRSSNPFERERVIATGNPPLTQEEAWVVPYFGPWLDARYKGNGGPARPGELRWFTQIDGKDVEVDNNKPFTIRGIVLRPRSRTFLPARLTDNPILMQKGYADVLNAMPEPLRSLLLFGDYDASYALQDDPWQVIPTAWIDAAMQRWKDYGNNLPNAPLTRIGQDTATNNDRFVIVKLYGDYYYDEIITHPGSSTPNGIEGAKKVVEALGLDPNAITGLNPVDGVYENVVPINLDILGGGSDVATILRDRGFKVYGFHGNAKSGRTDATGYIHYVNLRAEMYWEFRNALDPTYGSGICLPPDEELREELAAPRWIPTIHGIQIEDKLEIRKRLGRSPDKADSVVMAWLDMEKRSAHDVPVSSSVRGVGVGGSTPLPAQMAQRSTHDQRRDRRSPKGQASAPVDPYAHGRQYPQTTTVNMGARPVPVRDTNGEVRYVWEPASE
jgi:hypothetical protein